MAASPFVGPWVKFYLLWKADTRTPIENQTQSPPNMSRLTECCPDDPKVPQCCSASMWRWFASELCWSVDVSNFYQGLFHRANQPMSSLADLRSDRECWLLQEVGPLRELIGCESSWQPATRLQEDNSCLAVFLGSVGLFMVFPWMEMHAYGAAGLQCCVHPLWLGDLFRLSSRKEPLKEHRAKVHCYRFPETWRSVRCRTLNSIKFSPVTSAAQR